MCGGASGDDGQRQWQPRTPGEDFLDRGRFGREPGRVQPPPQQIAGLRRRQQVEADADGPVGHRECGEPAAAGDQNQTSGGSGQQWPNVVNVPGVVEHHEYSARGQKCAVQRRPVVQPGRDLAGGHTERVEAAPQRFGRREWLVGGVEAAHIHVQLAVREPGQVLVRPTKREPGLADAARPVDRHNGHRVAGIRGRLPGRSDPGEFAGATGEERWRSEELVGDWSVARRGRGRGSAIRCVRPGRDRRGQRRIAAENPLVHLLECTTRVDAELGGESGANLPIVGERIPGTAAAIQGQHELRRQAFVEWMLMGLGGQFAEHGAVLAAAQTQIGQVPLGRGPFGFEGIARGIGPRRVQVA